MKPSILDNNLLLVGAWIEGGRGAIVGSVRGVDGVVTADAISRQGVAWQALADALADAAAIGADGWVILCNDSTTVGALKSKRAPTPTEECSVWMGKGVAPLRGCWGGDAAHWAVLRLLAQHGKWTVLQSDNLQKARELWQQG